MSPLRAARSSSCTARVFTSGVASAATAFLSAVRSAERWARLRMAAARDFRMFFFAEAILGTKLSRCVWLYARPNGLDWNPQITIARVLMSRRHTTLTRVYASTTLSADAPPPAHSGPPRVALDQSALRELFQTIPVLLFAFVAHEWGHAY